LRWPGRPRVFNLGTSDFTNAYLLDAATGKPAFRAEGERGTVQEVSADFKTRTTLASGLRFLVGLAFNADGDLFATEQEGATWIANGNPFDRAAPRPTEALLRLPATASAASAGGRG